MGPKIQKSYSKKIYALMLILLISFFSSLVFSEEIIHFQIPFNHKIKISLEGSISADLDTPTALRKKIDKDYYGADSHGFSVLPPAPLVTPLQLGLVKLGGSLHASYNWKYNAYRNEGIIHYVYSPLIYRLNYVQKNYNADSMFEVNMLGWQPDINLNGMLVYKNTADSHHAGEAIRYLNGENKIGLKHVMMGNEPFDSEEFADIHVPSADEYIDKYIDYAMELRSAQEEFSGNPNDIKLWGPEINTGWTGWQTNHLPDCIIDYNQIEIVKCSYGNGKFKDFIPYFLYRLSLFENDPIRNPKKYKMLDYITIHYYALFRTDFNKPDSIIRNKEGDQDVAAMLESVNVWDSPSYVNLYDGASRKRQVSNIISTFKNWLKLYYPKAKMGLTEFGIDSVDKINYHPIVRPLYLADLVGRVGVAGLDTFINSFLQSGDVSNSWAMIDKYRKTRLYYVYSLFTNYFLGNVLTTNDTFGDIVNAYSVKTEDGINIFMINKDTQMHTSTLYLKTNETIHNISEIELPAWSMTVLIVPDNHNKMITVHQYGAKEMGIPVDLKMEKL